jgi:peptidyl-prolyl cis-trans isomerase C
MRIDITRRVDPRIARRRLARAMAMLILLAGCSRAPAPEDHAPARLSAPQEPLAASVNGEFVLASALEDEIDRLPEALSKVYSTPERRERALARIIDRRLLLQAARSRGLDRDPEFVSKMRDLKERLLIDALQRSVANETITDAAVEAYYREHPGDYTVEIVHVRHIEVKEEQEAREILEVLHGGGEFEELVRERSTHPSRRRGGALKLRRGRMDEAFDTAAFALTEPGQLSDVVRAGASFHIIELVEPPRLETRSLATVTPSIQQVLRQQATEDLTLTLRSDARIELYDGSSEADEN